MVRLRWLKPISPRPAAAALVLIAVVACTSTVRQVGSGDSDSGVGAAGSDSGGSGGGDASTSGGTGGSGGSAGAPSLDCSDLATEHCALVARCSSFLLQLSYGDEATCRARVELECRTSSSAPDAIPEAAAGCPEELAAAQCDVWWKGYPPECKLTGTRAAGAACRYGSQCSSGFCQQPVGSLACGQCMEYATEGLACGPAPCQPGLTCANGICIAPRQRGESCVDAPCAQLLGCVGGVCGDPLPLGAQCDITQLVCAEHQGEFCMTDPNGENRCHALQLAGLDQTCGAVGTEFAVCMGGMVCAQTTSTCVEAPSDGDACDAATNSSCRAPAVCVNGTCQVPNPEEC